VNYYLSKRTDVYLGFDYTKVADGEIDNGANTNTLLQFAGVPLGGQTSRTGVGIGFRTKF
jgi:predicted porin